MSLHALRRGFLLALMGLFLAAPALAGPGGGPGRLPNGKQLDRLADEIGLDAATKDKLKAQIQAAREAGKAKHEAVKAAKDRLHELLKADAPDRAAVMAQVAEVGRLETAAQQHRLGAMLDVFAALTPDQRAKLREKMSQRRGGRGAGRGGDEAGDDNKGQGGGRHGRMGKGGGRGEGKGGGRGRGGDNDDDDDDQGDDH